MRQLGPLLIVGGSALLGAVIAGLAYSHASSQRGTRTPGPTGSRSESLAVDLGIPEMLTRAGLAREVNPVTVLLIKILLAVASFLLAAVLLPLLPERVGFFILAGVVGLGFLAPDLLLARLARRRLSQIAASLPDALDLLAVSVGTGRQIGPAMAELGVRGRGPLAEELGLTARQIEWGRPPEDALSELRDRVRSPGIAFFCAALDRSRKLGSPLAEHLRRQATDLRHHHRRQIQEEAARAAPKIQLVIAFVLVPSVMLMLVAALVANSDDLLGVFEGVG